MKGGLNQHHFHICTFFSVSFRVQPLALFRCEEILLYMVQRYGQTIVTGTHISLEERLLDYKSDIKTPQSLDPIPEDDRKLWRCMGRRTPCLIHYLIHHQLIFLLNTPPPSSSSSSSSS